MNFKRFQTIETTLSPKRVLVIYGPRRIGKTTLLNHYLATQTDKRVYSSTGDDITIQEVFRAQSVNRFRDFAEPFDILAIDEAQQIPTIGIGAKMLIDLFPEKQIILTGSSSFDLASKVGEPLTGRHFTLLLLPVSLREFDTSRFEINQNLESLLRYGSYPEILNTGNTETREHILKELVSSYLYKDALALDRLKSPDLLRDITRMLAFQIGHEVSLNEIAVALSTDVKTVQRYLDILEKMFVIKRVRGWSSNLRNEISKKARYYFLDNGIRNAVIEQFQPLSVRNDIGALWENFVFMEILKKELFSGRTENTYFWRTHEGAEVDIVREYQGALSAIECKWSPARSARPPKRWRETYPESDFRVIHRDNYLDELL